ncbi:unnamed protein product [Toxocara canis]|uniref:Uncharacterized protein n=1 Tax=Toxocara canis TaxID=6265 RepID=A0A183UPK7_TOXCA|nr:unnamed protein product [Toxocara canis]
MRRIGMHFEYIVLIALRIQMLLKMFSGFTQELSGKQVATLDRFLSRYQFQYNINWSHLFNESLEPVYTVSGVDTKQVRQAKEEQCLFKSTFTNTTEREQEYSFKTERSTRSTATVVVEKGVCRGVEMALKLKTPGEVVEANAGFHNEVSVMHIGENTTEEELIWGVDSTVRVPPLCETVAELVILEEHHTRYSVV